MCGIFGIVVSEGVPCGADAFAADLLRLSELSQERGRDAAGLALALGGTVDLLRGGGSPERVLAEPALARALAAKLNERGGGRGFAAIGHCRLVTNGGAAVEDNNQPIHAGRVVGVHNGIVLNPRELPGAGKAAGPFLSQPSPGVDREVLGSPGAAEAFSWATAESPLAESPLAESDSQALFASVDAQLERLCPEDALAATFRALRGSASIAAFCGGRLLLATNTGSLYWTRDERGALFFASERAFLERLLGASKLLNGSPRPGVRQLPPGTGLAVGVDGGEPRAFRLDAPGSGAAASGPGAAPRVRNLRSDPASLRRCARCILPHTYPFIAFDAGGICNYCRRYRKQEPLGAERLEELLSRHRSKDGSPDCLVGFSGGRDSSYGLHLLKTRFGMHPIAYTYDWGLTTDASRRNQASMVSKLGVEHIIRAPDLSAKRRFVRDNIRAWLKSPHLGMVPLFMAGDKDFYHYGRALREELGLGQTVFCSGYQLEQREFMVGFCGIDEPLSNNKRLYEYSLPTKLRLAAFYSGQFLKNPAYINGSFADSIRSFLVSFVHKDDFLYLYNYLPWDEGEIERVLREQYDWEPDRAYGGNQWRMGDGQTAFTNYIYHAVAGFSEFDQFRSNQVREGLLTRERALELARADNRPKFATLQYFAQVIGINLEETLREINAIPKLY